LGITGPIGAGKNAAAAILERRGFATIDADLVAHGVMADKEAEILAAFAHPAEQAGVTLLDGRGKLDRRALGKLLFAAPPLLLAQEALLYPEITRRIEDFLRAHQDRPRGINATLLYKTPLMAHCPLVLFVDAPTVTRFFRIRKRNHLGAADILKRFHAQRKIFAQYLATDADIYTVNNTGSLAGLETRIDAFLAWCGKKDFPHLSRNRRECHKG
jgi:dephospho-CoA kinase